METRKKHSSKNPQETTNFLNLLVFGWTIPLFWKGARRDLQATDIYDPLKSDESERLADALEKEWKKELRKGNQERQIGRNGEKVINRKNKPSLCWAIIRTFWGSYMVVGVFLAIQAIILRGLQPVFQRWVISYFTQTDPNHAMTVDRAYLDTLGLVLTTFGIVLITHHTNLQSQQIGMRIRVACCSLIYRKVLRLNQAATSNTAAGQVVNLLSNDVSRFDTVLLFLHYIWIMPIQVPLIGYIMWQSVGVSTLVGIGVLAVQTIPIQGYLSILSARLRSEIAMWTDNRVQLMSELISGIQVVKMYAWEKPFELIVSKLRSCEIKVIGEASYLRGFYMSIMVFSERTTLFLTLISFVLMGNNLTAEVSFMLSTFFNILQLSMAICFPQALIMAGETAVSIDRLEEFLLMDEVKQVDHSELARLNLKMDVDLKESKLKQYKVRIEMCKIAANWVPSQLPPTLCDVSLTVESGSLCGLVGAVGSGKSSLLHLILGELPVGFGTLSFFDGDNDKATISRKNVRVSYSSQDAWLFTGSVRDNILFGEPYDKTKYQEVTRVCALLKDFEQLPQGDLSPVGERGASLSGGQRARVNLARAVYKDADLYLLDDPLSAVDTRVGRHLFQECIQGYLRDKTRILATHQLQYVQQADSIIILDRGIIKHQGTFEELSKSNLKFLKTNEDENTNDDASEHDFAEKHVERTISKTDGSKDIEVIQHDEDAIARSGNDEEQIESGALSNKIYGAYFSAGGNWFTLLVLGLVFVTGQVVTSLTDYWVSVWTNQEFTRVTKSHFVANDTTDDSFWFDNDGLFRQNVAIYIYTFWVLACIGFVTLRSMLFVLTCMKASRSIHNTMFANLLIATMRFFNTNPSGRILNRFSKDIGVMDELLPKAMLEGLQIFGVMIGILTLVIVTNYWMAIPTVIIGALFYVVRVYYLKTAQNVKRLEGTAKSPVFSLVNSSLDGLATIRSRGGAIEALLRSEFDQLQDKHTGAWYLTIATATALGFALDVISCFFVALVCVLFLYNDDGSTSGSIVGLSISQSLILTGMLQHGVRQSAEVVAQMTAVERVLQYTKLPQEGPFTTSKPPAVTWPAKGAVKFNSVSMKYSEDEPPVLKNLNINIQPGWKVGIVGRTGAGKSSLISALFRLVGDGLSGKIEIDEIDSKDIGLHELRPKISIIPQEPVLFSASLRYNLDPFEQYKDADLWESLREVELIGAVNSLDYQVAGGGANFSMGQRQLICLARAILRNNRILVLDEATANIDPRTDALIQNTIRRRFADCTVLTIAHRLNTIMDSDRVLVMERGRMMEFGHPHELLQDERGYFAQMVQQTGNKMSRNLAAIAEEAYKQNVSLNEVSSDDDATIEETESTNV